MPLAAGTLVGAYEIDRLLGTGGMGEVYRARDPRLNRFVALKVVPEELSAHAVRRERFRREALAIAALNHPNIVTVFAAEEIDGGLVLTMELVEGRTLADLIPKGGMPLDRLMKLAVQMADALGAAHERGIAHRDFKPRNVMVTADGRVKVLDFGLAKLRDPSGDGPDTHSTAPLWELTGEGRIVGTAAYMSPEQAEGRALDHRTDIFSLGIVLYEMATGIRPFAGESIVSVLSSILRDTPRAVNEVNPRLPRDLSRLIRRCLAKDPDERYQSAKDLRNDLNDLRQELSSGDMAAPEPGVSRRGVRRVALPAALVAAALTVGWQLARLTTSTPPPAAPVSVQQLTFDPGVEAAPSISPDGRWVVYHRVVEDHNDVFLQAVGGNRPINLTEGSASSNSQAVFSPDGERIAFASSRQGGGLFVMGRTGELARRVSARGYSPAWSPDGTRLVYSTSWAGDNPYAHPGAGALWIVDIESSAERLLVTENAVRPSWSPVSDRIAYWGIDPATHYRDLWTVPASGGAPTRVTADAAADCSPTWSPDGRLLYFASDRGGPLNLWRVAINAAGGAAGAPEPVTTPAVTAVRPTLSRDGHRLAYSTIVSEGRVRSFPLDETSKTVRGTPSWVAGGPNHWAGASVSPDGRRLALVRWSHQQDLFVMNTDGTSLRQLTDDPWGARCPDWSADSRSIAFLTFLRTERSVLIVDVGSRAIRKIAPVGTAGALGCPVWSPDGTRMAISQGPDQAAAFVFDPTRPWSDADVERLPDPPGGGTFVPRSWSPDGRRLAGSAGGSLATYELATRRYERLTPPGTVSAGGPAAWLPGSRHLVFPGPRYESLSLVDLAARQVRELLSVGPDVIRGFSASPDGRRLYVTSGPEEGDIWIATLR